ncbi:MAG: hemolysin family protein [Oscillospiraceae bacterium]|nr:hemolysin family protein [Oscillospiraceae bacterium]MDD7293422.1 hemolysin family protein [Clostridiaceae bacterium]MDY5990723.1 hemolysin family protein [Oscillospiraceae bacterium]
MDDPGSIILKLLLLFVLVIINAFFAMSEIAIISLNDNVVDKQAEDGNKKAKKVKKLTENPSNFLSTIQIGVTLAGFLTSASASSSFAAGLTEKLIALGTPIPANVINGISVVLITVIMSYFSLVFGELAPKRMAMQKPEKIAYSVVGILLVVKTITAPFVKVLSASTNLIVRLCGFDPNANEESVTEEEIRMMVDVGQEKGVIEDIQKEMIDNIFDFDDIDVSDIMTHRTDMFAVEDTDSLEQVVSISIEHGYSRIPVFHEDPDNIIGIVYIKDLLKYISSSLPKDKGPKDVMREAYYVPFSKSCGALFNEMCEKHMQMAVVVDEYGGTAGIVTMEDLLEAIVGNIQDEYDNEDEEIVEVSENVFTIDGTAYIEEVNELVGDIIPEGDYDTLGGFLISRLGYLPKDGDMTEVEFENLKFTILNVEDRRIGKIRVEITPKEETDDDPEESKDKE